MYYCEICDKKLVPYKTWLTHLLTEEHQKNLMESDAGISPKWINSTGIFISSQIYKQDPEKILEFFATFGNISNFYYDARERRFIVLYDASTRISEDTEEAAVGSCQSPNDKDWNWRVKVEKLASLTDKDWIALFPDKDFKPTYLTLESTEDHKQPKKTPRTKKRQCPQDLAGITTGSDYPNVKIETNDTAIIDEITPHCVKKTKKSKYNENEHSSTAPQPPFTSLKKQLKMFCKSETMTPEERTKREEIINSLHEVLQKGCFPYELRPRGSFLTGLGHSASRLDIIKQLGRSTGGSLNCIIEQFLAILRGEITTSIAPYQNLCCTSSESKIRWNWIDYTSQIRVHVKFSSDQDEVKNEYLLLMFLDLDKRIRPFLILVRYWAWRYKVTIHAHCKGINYTLLDYLVLVCCKMCAVAPSFCDLESEIVERFGKDALSCEPKRLIQEFKDIKQSLLLSKTKANNLSVLQLARQFFETFGDTDLLAHFVCTRSGKIISKAELQQPKQPLFAKFQWAPMNIGDPCNVLMNQNLVGNVEPSWVQKFQHECSRMKYRLERVLQCPPAELNFMSIFTDDP